MRVFSEFEKEIIRKIISSEGDILLKPNNYIIGLMNISSEVNIWGREINYKLKPNETHYYKIEIKGEKPKLYDDFFVLRKRLNIANDLFNYLISNNYILQSFGGNVAGLVLNNPKTNLQADNIETKELYINNNLNEFLEKCSYYYDPTESLKDLLSNNFRTKEERYLKKNILLSWIAIIVSILAVVIGLWPAKKAESPIIKNVLDVHSNLKIDTTTLKQIIHEINYSEIAIIDTSIILKHDTLKISKN